MILDARESCAGSNYTQNNEHGVADKIDAAIQYATTLKIPDTHPLMVKLKKALEDMKNVECYGDRLPIDQSLCEILNALNL
jgi:hypothetical protein